MSNIYSKLCPWVAANGRNVLNGAEFQDVPENNIPTMRPL